MTIALRLILLLALTLGVGHADIPRALAYETVLAPLHEVPSEFGTNQYHGWVEATDTYLIVRHPFDPATNLLSGMVEVFDRVSRRKLGELRPDQPFDHSWWAAPHAVHGHLLALGSVALDSAQGVEVFDLRTLNRLYRLDPPQGSATSGFGERLSAVGGRLLIDEVVYDEVAEHGGAIHIHDFETGAPLGKLAPTEAEVYFGLDNVEFSESSRFLLFRNEIHFLSPDNRYYAADLENPSRLIDLRRLPFLQPDTTYLDIELHESILLINEQAGESRRIHAYDVSKDAPLYSLDSPAGEWYLNVSAGNRLFVRDPWTGDGRVLVHDLVSGEPTTTILPPAGADVSHFGNTLASVNGTLFVASSKSWFAYDASTLQLLYTADAQGWHLSTAEVVPIAGSHLLGFVFNYPIRSGTFFNTYHYNPQVMLLDPQRATFTHRLDLEDGIIISGDIVAPRAFGRRLFAAGEGSIGVLRPGEYSLYSLTPSTGEIGQKLVAAVSFESELGYEFAIQRMASDGEPETVDFIPYGTGRTATLDLPYADHAAGVPHRLVRRQLAHHTSEYDLLVEEVLLRDREASDIVVHDGIAAFSVPDYDTPFANAGAVFLLDIEEKKILRMIQPPEARSGDRFGSSLDFAGGRLAVCSERATYVYDALTGEKNAEFPAAMTVHLTGNLLVRAYNDYQRIDGNWTYLGMVAVHDLVTGRLLHTTPTGYSDRFSYYTTRTAAGTDHLLLGLQVHDLRTGEFLHTLASPAPAPDDGFGYRIAADGPYAAVAAYGQGTVYLFDLRDGRHTGTFRVHDRPNGFVNYALSGAGLVLDAVSGLLAWTARDGSISERNGIHLFDIHSGNEIMKLSSPLEEVVSYPSPAGSGPPITSLRPSHSVGDALALSDGNLIFLQDRGQSIAAFDPTAFRARPLVHEVRPLTTSAFFEVSVKTRRDTSYQLLSGLHLTELTPFGDRFPGNGENVIRRIPVEPGAAAGFAAFHLQWTE